ncbi:MAG: ABC transporter permease, partial [Bryobacteraceae bacterium]
LSAPGVHLKNLTLSKADYFTFREQSRTFQDIGIYTAGSTSVSLTGIGQPERVRALPVTHDVLPILGVKPLVGRLFTQADDSPGGTDTIILTYGYRRRKFGDDRSVIGRTIDADGKPRTIIGVLPQSFRFLDKTDLAVLLPIQLDRAATTLGDFSYLGIARLKPGVTLAEANADVARMIPIMLRSFPPPLGGSLKGFERWRMGPNLRPLKQEVVGNVGKVLWVLLGGIGLVLLIACANVANLLLLRVDGRRQELAIRAALGASRGRIAAELLLESLILAVFGGLLGLGLAYGALRVLVAMAPPSLPRLNEIGIDGTVVLFALAVSIAASLLFGSVPVFKYAGAASGTRLREGGCSMSESRARHRSRGVLVIVQVALALVLLVSSGLMIRTFRALTRVDPGFVAPAEVQTFRVYIPETQVKDPVQVVRMEQEISQKLAAIPGVSSVGISKNLPMDGSFWFDRVVAKHHVQTPGQVPRPSLYAFSAPGFLKTLGTRLIAGRSFTWRYLYNKAPVAMVSEKFARTYWHSPANALDKQFRLNTKDGWRKVIGVVENVHEIGVNEETPTFFYVPILMDQFFGNPASGARRNVAFAIRSPRAGSE